MTIKRTLWDFLDTSSSPPGLLDSQDDDVEGAYFGKAVARNRWRIGITAAIALGGLIVLVVIGGYFYRAMSPVAEVMALDSGPSPAGATGVVSSSAADSPRVRVHVVGAVANPGVVSLPVESRVEDALDAAGGPRDDALLAGVNLARELFDGEQIMVPSSTDQIEGGGLSSGGLVSLSRATTDQLQDLPRVGPATAQRIISWREANGPFRSVEDLLAVSGIGPATLDGLRDLVVP